MDVVALGELLIDFTENGISSQGNPLFEANPGGAPCNVLAMLTKLGHKTAFKATADFVLEQPWLSLFFYPYKRDCSADYVEQTEYDSDSENIRE